MDSNKQKQTLSQEVLAGIRNVKPVVSSPASLSDTRKFRPSCGSDDSQSLTSFPKLLPQWLHLETKEQKLSEILLDIPKGNPSPNTKQSCNFCSRSNSELTERSNWDHFFDSNTERTTDSRNISRLGTDESMDWWFKESTPSSTLSPHDKHRSIFPAPRKDKVLIWFKKKTDIKWTSKNSSARMGEVAEWLNEGVKPKCKLAIYGNTQGKTKSGKIFEKLTIAEAVSDLNPLRQGLVCFVGPIDTKWGFRISVCDLDKIIAATCSCVQIDDEKI